MEHRKDFGDIRPYTDAEAAAALGRVARHPMLPVISKYLFPGKPAFSLRRMLSGIRNVEQFQGEVMFSVVEAILEKTSEGFTCGGLEHLQALHGKRFLAVSNHRDIVLDPALVQYALHAAGFPCTEICVGSNLITSQLIEDLMRSNRMIKVIRGIAARELYLSSRRLSQYIRERIVSGEASVWIAQREGRTKNGLDTTEQGLLKMFDMSGPGGEKRTLPGDPPDARPPHHRRLPALENQLYGARPAARENGISGCRQIRRRRPGRLRALCRAQARKTRAPAGPRRTAESLP